MQTDPATQVFDPLYVAPPHCPHLATAAEVGVVIGGADVVVPVAVFEVEVGALVEVGVPLPPNALITPV